MMESSTSRQSSDIIRFHEDDFHSPDSFYFYHIIDTQDWTLQVQALGPNLSFTFYHQRMPGVLCAQHLMNKTVGFVAINSSSPSSTMDNQSRRIIAWAQSGHGLGAHGDPLLAGGYALANQYWAKRAIDMAKVLGMNDHHPYDFGPTGSYRKERVGCFYASHVEVKLATHAVHALLNLFEIPYKPNRITRRTLAKLINRRHEDGSVPVVEIFFSRKNCRHCEKFITRLQISTGLRFRLIWKHRLQRMLFKNEMSPVAPGPPQETIVIDDGDEEPWITSCEPVEIDAPEDDNPLDISESFIVLSDEEDDNDLEIVRTPTSSPATSSSFVHVDRNAASPHVMNFPSEARSSSADYPIQIDDKEENKNEVTGEMQCVVDLTTHESSKSRREDREEVLNRWIDGIRFALGQAECRPAIARAATLDLVRSLVRHRRRQPSLPVRPSTPQRARSQVHPVEPTSAISVITIRTRGRSRS